MTSGFKSYNFYNFQAGIDKKNQPIALMQSEKESAWSDGLNVELLDSGGICKMKGSTVFHAGVGEKITGGYEGQSKYGNFLVVMTESGKFYYFNGSDFILEKENLSGSKPNFRTYYNGVFVTNGVDDPFLFDPFAQEKIRYANASLPSGDIRGKALEVYKGRLWIAQGASLYYSALGKFNDWTTENDAGSISNFHNDTNPILALCAYRDYLVIHKKDSTFLLAGNQPDNFVIQPFNDKGCISPWGINVANDMQVFFNNGLYPFKNNAMGQMVVEDALSDLIVNELKNFQNANNSQAIILNYKSKSQLWCFVYRSSKNYFDKILIWDYINKCWFFREVPYKIVSAWEYDDKIMTTDENGRLIIEGIGADFCGERIPFQWFSPFYHMNTPNRRKSTDEFYLILANNANNNFNFATRKDYSTYEFDDDDIITNIEANTLVCFDDAGFSGQGVLDSDDKTYGFVTLNDEGATDFRCSISGSSKSIQIVISGNKPEHDMSLLGFEFRDVFVDD